MKTIKLSVLLLLLGSLPLTSCKKKGCTDSDAVNYDESAKKNDGTCNFKPVITVVGTNPATVNVGASYSDAGATAFVKNGDVTDVVTDLSEVNTSQTGSFTVTYSATNEHGTSTATRTVNVVLGQSSYIGTYSTTDDCDDLGFPHITEPQIIAGSNSNQLILESAFTVIGGTIVFNISGENVTVPATSIPITIAGFEVGTLDFSGTGTMNATGTEMTVSYDWTRTGQLEDQGFCTIVYTK